MQPNIPIKLSHSNEFNKFITIGKLEDVSSNNRNVYVLMKFYYYKCGEKFYSRFTIDGMNNYYGFDCAYTSEDKVKKDMTKLIDMFNEMSSLPTLEKLNKKLSKLNYKLNIES